MRHESDLSESIRKRLEMLKPGQWCMVTATSEQVASSSDFSSRVHGIGAKISGCFGCRFLTRKQTMKGCYALFVMRLPEGVQ